MSRPYNDDEWVWGRQYQRSIHDDYYPADSWGCTLYIPPAVSITPYKGYQDRLTLIVHVHGKRGKNNKLRAVSWFAYLESPLGRHHWRPKAADQWRGKCKSVIDARRQANRLVTPEVIREHLGEIYGPTHAVRLFRKNEEPEDDHPAYIDQPDWVPYATVFGRYFPWRTFPTGEYLAVRWSASLGFTARTHSRSRWGHSSKGADAPRLWWGPLSHSQETT